MKGVTFPPRNTNIYKIYEPRRDIFSVFYNISPPNIAILTNIYILLLAVAKNFVLA